MTFGFLADLPLPGYRALLAIGLVLGVGVAVLVGRRRGVAPLPVVDAALAAAAGALLVGRAAYTVAHWAYFRDHLLEAIAFWRGGLSGPGALVGGLAGVLTLCRLRQTDHRPLLDVLAPGAAVVTIAAWLGCLGTGCACGLETWPDEGLLWSLSAELPDLYGLRAPRVAVQVLGGGWNAVVLAATLLIGQRGRSFPWWLALHAAGDFALAFLRGDLVPLVAGFAAVQVADLALALVGLGLLAIPSWPQRQ